MEKNDLEKVSMTDPECRFMKSKKGSFDSGYYEGENLKYLIDKKIDGYIPSQRKT